jgi:hypothetical protein
MNRTGGSIANNVLFVVEDECARRTRAKKQMRITLVNIQVRCGQSESLEGNASRHAWIDISTCTLPTQQDDLPQKKKNAPADE